MKLGFQIFITSPSVKSMWQNRENDGAYRKESIASKAIHVQYVYGIVGATQSDPWNHVQHYRYYVTLFVPRSDNTRLTKWAAGTESAELAALLVFLTTQLRNNGIRLWGVQQETVKSKNWSKPIYINLQYVYLYNLDRPNCLRWLQRDRKHSQYVLVIWWQRMAPGGIEGAADKAVSWLGTAWCVDSRKV